MWPNILIVMWPNILIVMWPAGKGPGGAPEGGSTGGVPQAGHRGRAYAHAAWTRTQPHRLPAQGLFSGQSSHIAVFRCNIYNLQDEPFFCLGVGCLLLFAKHHGHIAFLFCVISNITSLVYKTNKDWMCKLFQRWILLKL